MYSRIRCSLQYIGLFWAILTEFMLSSSNAYAQSGDCYCYAPPGDGIHCGSSDEKCSNDRECTSLCRLAASTHGICGLHGWSDTIGKCFGGKGMPPKPHEPDPIKPLPEMHLHPKH